MARGTMVMRWLAVAVAAAAIAVAAAEMIEDEKEVKFGFDFGDFDVFSASEGDTFSASYVDMAMGAPILMMSTYEFKVNTKMVEGMNMRVAGQMFASSPIAYYPSRGFFNIKKSGDGPATLVCSFDFVHPTVEGKFRGEYSESSATVEGSLMSSFMRPVGVRIEKSMQSQSEAVEALENAIRSNPDGPALIANIDHMAMAATKGIKIPPSNVVVFGRPQLGSPLWRARAPIGVELPVEILIATTPLGSVYVAYNTPSYLKKRFGLPAKNDALLGVMDMALNNLAGVASGQTLTPVGLDFDAEESVATAHEDLITIVTSDQTPSGIRSRFDQLFKSSGVEVAYQIDHEVSALNQDLPTGGKRNKVIVFGESMMSPRLIQAGWTIALDLPFRLGVWNTMFRGDTYVGYTNPIWLCFRHNICDDNDRNAALGFDGLAPLNYLPLLLMKWIESFVDTATTEYPLEL